MSYLQVVKSGVVVEEWSDESRTVTYYHDNGSLRPSAPGGELPNPRPYSPEENNDADSRQVDQTVIDLENTLRSGLDLAISDLKDEKARVQPIIDKLNSDVTGKDTKDVARAAKRIADAVIDALQLIKGLD